MSNQSEQEKPQPETSTPQEVRQFLLAELEASQQIILELNDEQLIEITGGGNMISGIKAVYQVERDLGEGVVLSATSAITQGPRLGIEYAKRGITDPETMRVTMRNAAIDDIAKRNLEKFKTADLEWRKKSLKRSRSW